MVDNGKGKEQQCSFIARMVRRHLPASRQDRFSTPVSWSLNKKNIIFILYAIYKFTSRFVMSSFSQQAGQGFYTSQFEFATSFITFSVRYQAETK